MDDSDEDFGYDFSPDEEQLLLQLASASPTVAAVVQQQHHAAATIDSLPEKETGVSPEVSRLKNEPPSDDVAVLADTAVGQNWSADDAMPPKVHDSVAYPNLSRALEELGSKADQDKPVEEPASEEESEDGRSPLQRFRSFPRRPLTVTDLTAGAWCELQYWYTLTKLPGGRRTRTAAMREGSKVHQKLEDEVHTTVRVEVTSREDAFGLRLWNFIQGLRTLRDTGLTRELEVWGMLNGNLVNGVIDVLSYENPNPDFEDELGLDATAQPKMTDFFVVEKPKKQPTDTKKIYLTDVKTRGSATPVSKATLRPAKIQLLLYHRFLSEMASDKLDLFRAMRRYGLDADEPFSDGFLAQIGSLHDEIFDFTSPKSSIEEPGASAIDSTPQSGTDGSNKASQLLSTPDIVKYSSLRELISLVKEEIQLAFPEGSGSMGNMLQVQYVHREDGRVLDLHDFPVSPTALQEYLGSYMKWWQGERKATGVEIEEAFKCRTCEFAETCSWRRDMDNERVRKARAKSRSVTAS